MILNKKLPVKVIFYFPHFLFKNRGDEFQRKNNQCEPKGPQGKAGHYIAKPMSAEINSAKADSQDDESAKSYKRVFQMSIAEMISEIIYQNRVKDYRDSGMTARQTVADGFNQGIVRSISADNVFDQDFDYFPSRHCYQQHKRIAPFFARDKKNQSDKAENYHSDGSGQMGGKDK